MKKITFFKTFLVAAGLLAGSSAYAQEQFEAVLKHTASASWGSNTGRNTVDSEAEYYNNESGSGWAGAAFAEFDLTGFPQDGVITKVTLDWKALNGNTNGDRNNQIYCLNAGQTLDYDDIQENENAHLFSNLKTFVTNVPVARGVKDIADKTDVTDVVKTIIESEQSYVIFQWTGNGGGADLAGKASADAPKLVIEYLVGISDVDIALLDLGKAIEVAQTKANNYVVGEGLFQYPSSEMSPLNTAIAKAQAAHEAAESAEAVKAATEALNSAVEAFAPVMNVPEPTQAYILSLKTSAGTFQLSIADGIKIKEIGTPIYFVAQDNGDYALSNGTEYVNYDGSNTWTLAASANAYGWTVAALADGGYTINGKNGFLGTNTSDGNDAESSCYGDKKTSNGNYIWTIAELTEIKVNVTDAGWATLYTTVALDFSKTGLTAYTATCDGKTVTLAEVKTVPANTGVVLKGAKDEYTIPVIASSETAQGDLKGSATATPCTAADGYYILTTVGEDKVQFNLATSGEIAAGKAYLQIAGDGDSKLRVVIEGEATAISDIATEKAENGATYNVAGQLVDDNYKGIVIKNGKKYLNK